MALKIFWKNNCPSCPKAKAFGKHLQAKGYEVEYLNVEEPQAMQQAMSYSIMSVPTIIATEGKELIGKWAGMIPSEEELKQRYALMGASFVPRA